MKNVRESVIQFTVTVAIVTNCKQYIHFHRVFITDHGIKVKMAVTEKLLEYSTFFSH